MDSSTGDVPAAVADLERSSTANLVVLAERDEPVAGA